MVPAEASAATLVSKLSSSTAIGSTVM